MRTEDTPSDIAPLSPLSALLIGALLRNNNTLTKLFLDGNEIAGLPLTSSSPPAITAPQPPPPAPPPADVAPAAPHASRPTPPPALDVQFSTDSTGSPDTPASRAAHPIEDPKGASLATFGIKAIAGVLRETRVTCLSLCRNRLTLGRNVTNINLLVTTHASRIRATPSTSELGS